VIHTERKKERKINTPRRQTGSNQRKQEKGQAERPEKEESKVQYSPKHLGVQEPSREAQPKCCVESREVVYESALSLTTSFKCVLARFEESCRRFGDVVAIVEPCC
jgi:hypothetical protein